MSGLLSARFEKHRSIPYVSEFESQREFALLTLRVENASRIKTTLEAGRLNPTQLALAEFQLKKLEIETQTVVRMEGSKDLQQNLILRCEGVFSAVFDFIAKIFAWVADTLSSLFGGGSSSNSSNNDKAEATIERVEEKIEKASTPEDKESEERNQKNREEIAAAEKKETERWKSLTPGEQLREQLRKGENKEMAETIISRLDKIEAEKEAKKNRPKLSLADADKNFTAVIKVGSPFWDVFDATSNLHYSQQLQLFRDNLKAFKRLTHELKDLVNFLDKGDEMVGAFEKILKQNSNQHPFPKDALGDGAAFISFGSMKVGHAMLMGKDNGKSLSEVTNVRQEHPTTDKNNKVKVSELFNVIKGTAIYFSDVQDFSKELEEMAEASQKYLRAQLSQITEENRAAHLKNMTRVARLYKSFTEFLVSCRHIESVFTTIDQHIDIVESI